MAWVESFLRLRRNLYPTAPRRASKFSSEEKFSNFLNQLFNQFVRRLSPIEDPIAVARGT
jgi:hypothetical protein